MKEVIIMNANKLVMRKIILLEPQGMYLKSGMIGYIDMDTDEVYLPVKENSLYESGWSTSTLGGEAYVPYYARLLKFEIVDEKEYIFYI